MTRMALTGALVLAVLLGGLLLVERSADRAATSRSQSSRLMSADIRSGSPAENGDHYNVDNDGDGRVEPVFVRGHYRKNGTYVRSHYRARARR